MPVYSYEGKTTAGEMKKGELTAPNAGTATAVLRRRQIIPSLLTEKKGWIDSLNLKMPIFGGKVKRGEIIVFTRLFATMINAGLPIVQCLNVLQSQQENPLFKKVIFNIRSSIENGSTLASALRSHPEVFGKLYINMIAVAEVGGLLDITLDRISRLLEKIEKTKGEVKKALTYPLIVLSSALLIVIGLLIFVVPIFEGMFKGFGEALPLPTQIVINLSNVIKDYWYAMVLAPLGIYFGLKQFYRTEKGVNVIDTLKLRLPLLGGLFLKAAIARFARILATMISSGVPILAALDIVSKTAGNRAIEGAVMRTRTQLSRGRSFSEALKEEKIFPELITQMIQVGESSGAIDAMLAKVADFYEEEVDRSVASLTSIIEPLLMLFLGVIIGGVVFSLYLPIFQLAGGAGG